MANLDDMFGIGDLPDSHLPTRIQIAHCMRIAVRQSAASGGNVIVMQMPHETALLIADDIDFAVSIHPTGIPPGELSPHPFEPPKG